MSIFTIYLIFLKYGLLCIGGGYVLVPMMLADFVEQESMLSHEEFGNLVSIAQVTPGPVGINAATYVGFTQGGFAGSLAATLGILTPSLVLASLATYFLVKLKGSVWVKGLMNGARPAALGLLVYASYVFSRISIFTDSGFSPAAAAICAVVVFLLLKTRLSMTAAILLSAAAGALFCR